MVKINGIVNSPIGLTSKVCAELVAEANRATKCDLTIFSGDDSADLKSIMNMMSLFIHYNQEFTIEISGENEEEVKHKMLDLLKNLNLLKE